MKDTIHSIDLGHIRFADAWDVQRSLWQRRVDEPNDSVDTVLYCEHPHVYTLGRITEEKNILFTKDFLKTIDAESFEIDRGGDVTYHGPGQVVGYPIFWISETNGMKSDLHWYLRCLEEVLITALREFDIEGTRVEGRTGVWAGQEKIAAIGIKCSRWVTMHGFALNVATDLSYFNNIVPCGITDCGVTSMEKILGKSAERESVLEALDRAFEKVFMKNIYRVEENSTARSLR